MVARSFPPYPAFPSLRLAVASDIPRMAHLSVLGFKDSEIFRYERPHYEEFPRDAVASFANIYRAQLRDERAVAIVAEDWQQAEEELEPDCPETGASNSSQPYKRVVVGVASWIFPQGSPRTGQFVDPDVGEPEPTPDRDICQSRLELFTRISTDTEQKFFESNSICNKLVVHPSYQRRGHGTSMLKWGLRLSKQDGVDTGVIPAHQGEPLYLSLGYKIIGEMEIPDHEGTKGFTQRVCIFAANANKVCHVESGQRDAAISQGCTVS